MFLKDAWYWPADFLEELLAVPSVDVCPFSLGMPSFETTLSIPNHVAWMPQLGTSYTPSMVSFNSKFLIDK